MTDLVVIALIVLAFVSLAKGRNAARYQVAALILLLASAAVLFFSDVSFVTALAAFSLIASMAIFLSASVLEEL